MSAFVRAFPHFIAFELLYKMIMLAIGAPLLTLLLKLTMKASGINYLSDQKLLSYISNPVTIIAAIITMFVLAFFSYVELSALAACFSCVMKHEKITVGGMFRSGFRSFVKAFRGTGILHFLLFMLFIPMAQFTISSGIFMAPLMSVMRMLFRSVGNKSAVLVFFFLELLFAIIIISRSYSIHYLILTDKKFHECTVASRKTINGNKMKMALSLILWSLFAAAAALIITFVISFIVMLFIKGFSRPGRALSGTIKVLKYAGKIFLAVSSSLSSPAVMCWLTGRFFADVDPEEKLTLPNREPAKMKTPVKIALFSSAAAAGLMLNLTYFNALYKNKINLNVGILNRTNITAHRGYSSAAPENTLYAFQAAIDSGADFIELDVQLTKDEQLVVFHDENIDRVTNGKGTLNSYTYDELQQFSAGSWFGDTGEFSDAKIPLFSDVLELCGDNIMLNIEIKNYGSVQLTTEKTVELIHEYGISDSCYITSFSYSALKKAKKLDPKIKTGLIANISSTSAYTNMDNIDALSLNYAFVTPSVVNSAHQNGKRVFVWTVDRSADIKKMKALGVDNIITNRPETALNIVYSNKLSEKILTILNNIFG